MKLAYTIIYVPSVADTLAFYNKAFGLPTRFLDPSGAYGELETGSATLAFASFETAKELTGGEFSPVDAHQKPLGFEIALTTENVEQAFETAVRAGASPLKSPEQKPWGQTVAYVRSLEGTLVEICTSMDEESASDGAPESDSPSISQSISALFAEVFDGTQPGAAGTWFVQGDEALEATLDATDSVQASKLLAPGVGSIAAHVIHTAYYMELAAADYAGEDTEPDWEGSWKVQSVTPDEWVAVRARLKEARRNLGAVLQGGQYEGSQDELTYAVANLGHAAYHLGAIRQLYLLSR